MELAKAYVQIIPSASGIKGNIEKAMSGEVSAAGSAAGTTLGKNLVGTAAKIIAAAGFGKMIKDSLDAGGALQQSFGGLDTIYGDASEAAKEYSKEAAKAGISMNDYAEQAVSFGASLKQAYEGDTMAAVEAANVAILDMADNSAKMGTSIESIQNAYQGFAKQNYTMLDNLKLGYGGTKTEMERLLADAEKLSGIHYDISNLGDVYSAIHVIQEDIGLTGVAAAEAEGTFTGSMAAMSASIQNLKANLALGNDISQDLQIVAASMGTFLTGNLMPMLKNIISAVPSLIQFALDQLPGLFTSAAQAMTNFAAQMDFSQILGDAGAMISQFLQTLTDNIPLVISAGTEMIGKLAEGLRTGIPDFIGNVVPMITQFTGMLLENSGSIVDSGINLIKSLVQGLIDGFPVLIANVPQIIINIADIINTNLPKILKAGLDIIIMLGKGIIENIPVIIANIGKIVEAIFAVIQAVNWLDLGASILKALASGIKNMIGFVVNFAKEFVKSFGSTIKNFDWLGLGKSIVTGLINGVKALASGFINVILDLARSAFDGIKSFFGIGSPSKLMRDEIGKWIPAGIAEGIEANASDVQTAMTDLAAETAGSFNADLAVSGTPGSATGQTVNYGGVTINVTAQDAMQSQSFIDWIEMELTRRTRNRVATGLA